MNKKPDPIIHAPEINTHTIAAIVKNVTGIKNLLIHVNFKELGLTENHLIRIQTHILKNFKRTVQRVEFQDTVATLTDKLIVPRA